MYFPEKDSASWKYIKNKTINYKKLQSEINRQQLFFGNYPQSILIIKNGEIIFDHYSFMTLPQSRFDVWSCTKSFTGLAWFLLLDEISKKTNPKKKPINLHTKIYKYLPKSFIDNDLRKKEITLHHLLSMTSGIPGESHQIYGLVTQPNFGPYEFSLGMCDNRYGKSVAKLTSKPGTQWDYSDAGAVSYTHLTLPTILLV